MNQSKISLELKIDLLHKEISKEVLSSNELCDEFRLKYLSRKGKVAELFDELRTVSAEEKPKFGKTLNELRNYANNFLEDSLKNFSSQKEKQKIDLSLPGRELHQGSIHLITQTMEEIQNIFISMGFDIELGPEIEDDYHNFEALNFPPDHPARDMQDTFFLENDILLRTHTTSVQIRIMETKRAPIRAIMPGRVFRNEAISVRSYCLFHQIDGVYIDKNVSFSELKGTLISFAKSFYGNNIKYKFRPSFFPFTEPSLEMDITCFLCKGSGCRVCKNSGWLEILGAGMVHPNIYKKVGYNADEFSGFAFGMGVERIAMLRHGISDIRILYENDLRMLKQF